MWTIYSTTTVTFFNEGAIHIDVVIELLTDVLISSKCRHSVLKEPLEMCRDFMYSHWEKFVLHLAVAP